MNRLLVVAYQKIGTPPANSSLKEEWTSLRTLTHQLDLIQQKNLTTLTADQAAAQLSGGEVTPGAVLLLFLDGYRSFYNAVYPLLKERNLSACIGLPMAHLGTYNAWQDPRQESWQDLLSLEEIKDLEKDPHISFSAQALNRLDITSLPEQEASYQVKESLFRLGKITAAPTLFTVFPAKHIKANPLPGAGEITSLFPGKPAITWALGNSWRTTWKLRWHR